MLAPFAGWLIFISMSTQKAHVLLFLVMSAVAAPLFFQNSQSGASGNSDYEKFIIPASILGMMLSSRANFNVLYVGHRNFFPLVFSGTSMAIVNVVARSLTTMAPVVAEISQPIPVIIISILGLVGSIVSCFVKEKTNTYYWARMIW